MSRGRPLKSTNPLRVAHSEFVAALAGNSDPIYSGTNADDLDARPGHLENILASLHAYLAVIVGDTARNIPGATLDHRSLDNLFQDLSADAVGAIRKAAKQMRDDKRDGEKRQLHTAPNPTPRRDPWLRLNILLRQFAN
jgi:hypothetical protein